MAQLIKTMIFAAILSLFAFFGIGLAAQKVYKCVDESGTVAFSQSPCSANAKVETVDGRSPREKASDSKKIWKLAGRANIQSARQCLQAWRPRLKDPDSGRLASDNSPGILVRSPLRTVVVSEGRARNGFGGMSVQYFVCDIDANGDVIGDGNPFGDLSTKAESVEEYGLQIAFPGIPD